jgi:hypothetical protein
MPPCRLAAVGRHARLGCPRPVPQRMRPSPGPTRPWGAPTPSSSGKQIPAVPAASAWPTGAPPPEPWEDRLDNREERLDRQEEERMRPGKWLPVDSPERAARYVLSHRELRHILQPDYWSEVDPYGVSSSLFPLVGFLGTISLSFSLTNNITGYLPVAAVCHKRNSMQPGSASVSGRGFFSPPDPPDKRKPGSPLVGLHALCLDLRSLSLPR